VIDNSVDKPIKKEERKEGKMMVITVAIRLEQESTIIEIGESIKENQIMMVTVIVVIATLVLFAN
jgi:hypothetical protein